MVEPSEVNRDRTVRVYGAEVKSSDSWLPLLEWKKDPLPSAFSNTATPSCRVAKTQHRSWLSPRSQSNPNDTAISLYKLNEL